MNLGALVLIGSFLQRNEVIQYVLLAVTVVIIVAVVVSALRGLSSKRFTLLELLSQDGDDYVSLGIWLLVASLTFYLGPPGRRLCRFGDIHLSVCYHPALRHALPQESAIGDTIIARGG